MKRNNLEKENRKLRAEQHMVWCASTFEKEISDSIEGTKFYSKKVKVYKDRYCGVAEFTVEDIDTVSAAVKYSKEYDGKVALLNFASYKNPGGGFLKGSMAQEEALCHGSFLYNVIGEFDKFYDWNLENLNRSLYMERALYSPNVYFFKDKHYAPCDVITCACPNKKAALKNKNITEQVNSRVLRDRIKFVLDIAERNNVDTLILGAYGCGVFGQDPYEVAEVFKEYLISGNYGFEKVVFAVPKGKIGYNLSAFEKVFEGV